MLLRRYGGLALGVLVLAGIWTLSLISYLLFHTVVEITSMVVSFCIFTLAWNQRRTMDNGYLLFVGLAALFIGVTDLLHAMTYKGMGVFPTFGADHPTQFWIAGRFIQTLTFLAAPFFLNRKVRTTPVIIGYVVLTALLCWSVFARVFPACYIDGVGLTPFKKVTEYVVSALLLLSLYLLRRRKESFDPHVLRLMTWTIALTIVGELAFTLYIGVTDQFNRMGHIVRLVSYCLLYLTTVQTGLTRPFALLFRNLKQSEEALQKERNFVAGVLDSAGALMIVTDPTGHIIRFNRACEELSGYREVDVAGRRLTDFLTPSDEMENARRMMSHLRQNRTPVALESRWILANGSSRWISWTVSSIKDERGKIQYVVGSGLDITERRQAEAELRESEERLRMMVDSVQTGMLLVDQETHAIVSANPAAAAMIGLPAEAIVGRRCAVFLKCAAADGSCPLATTGQAAQDAVLKTFDGRELPIHRTAVAVMSDGRKHLMESFVDMSAQKRMEEELRSLSMIDELTGLYNRRGFLTLAPKEIAAADRVGGSVVLLLVDISGLKEINDTYGHLEGDRVLVTMAHILREAFRESTLIARFGSDEFGVLAPQFVGARPSMLVDRLERLLEDYNTTNGRDYEIRVNIGVARTQPQKPSSPLDLISQADNALYVEKRQRAMAR